jgi:hypothetical protein
MHTFTKTTLTIVLVVLSLSGSALLMGLTPVVLTVQYMASVDIFEYSSETQDTVSFVTTWGEPTWTPTMQNSYDEAIYNHLVDVHEVYHATELVFLFFIALLITLLITHRRSGEYVRRGVRRNLGWAILLIMFVAIAGVVAFEPIFTFVHGLLFKPGTWLFPESSLLIRTFPERFWLIWGVGILVVAIGILECVRLLCLVHGSATTRSESTTS